MGNVNTAGSSNTEDSTAAGTATTDPAGGTSSVGNPETGATVHDDAQQGNAAAAQTAGEHGSTDDAGGDAPETGEAVEALTADRDKWKALARKNEDRAKSNAAAVEALKAAETERDELKAQAEESAERAGSLEAENARLLAALKHGLADSDLRFLKGVPVEELDSAASDLAQRMARAPQGRRFLGRETPPGGGAEPGDFLRSAMKRTN